MKRTAAVLVTTVVAVTTLAGCSGDDPYCEAVDKNQSMLNTFGNKKTDAGYATYAKTLSDVGKVAPSPVKKDWTTLSKATTDVIGAQKEAGVKLEDMSDPDQVKGLDEAQLKNLNDAYKAFNATTKQRNAIVKNVLQECDIKLK